MFLARCNRAESQWRKTPKVRITFAKHEHQMKLRQPGGLLAAVGHDDAAAGVADMHAREFECMMLSGIDSVYAFEKDR